MYTFTIKMGHVATSIFFSGHPLMYYHFHFYCGENGFHFLHTTKKFTPLCWIPGLGKINMKALLDLRLETLAP